MQKLIFFLVWLVVSTLLLFSVNSAWALAGKKVSRKSGGDSKQIPATYLSFCTGQKGLSSTVVFSADYWQPNGEKMSLVLSRQMLGTCPSHYLPLSPDNIQWAGSISGTVVTQLSKGVILEGSINQPSKSISDEFIVEDVSPLMADEDSLFKPDIEGEHEQLSKFDKNNALPAGTNLLPRMEIIPFGQEERVLLERKDRGISLSCKAGRLPAGVLFRQAEKELPGPDFLLEATFSGEGHFNWAISDKDYGNKDDSIPLGSIEANANFQSSKFLIPKSDFNVSNWRSFTLVCPNEDANLTLSELMLKVSEKNSLDKTSRSGWIWQPLAWQETHQVVIKKLLSRNINRVYISVPIADAATTVLSPEELKYFISLAHGHGIQVWAVEGDRYALLPSEQIKFIQRAKALADYNLSVKPEFRLSGIQYDIEPYLMKGYSLNNLQWNEPYITLLRKIRAAKNTELSNVQDNPKIPMLQLEVIVPFWFNQQKSGRQTFLDKLAPIVGSLSVMDYRTDMTLIQKFAEPYLDWGIRYRKPVHIALEATVLPDSISKVFRANESKGTLVLIEKDGWHLLVLLKEPIASSKKTRVFAYSHQIITSSNTVTFSHDKKNLRVLIDELESKFLQWPSFAGMAIHGIE